MNLADKLKLLIAAIVVAGGVTAFYLLADAHALLQMGALVAAILVAVGIALTSSPGKAGWEFLRAASREVKKVVWPTNRETTQSTLAVVLIVIVVGIYISILDFVLKQILHALT